MNLAELSDVAKKYYIRVKEPSTVQGWEKYVLTDGTNCVFVKSNYIPKQGETVFFLQMRNCNVMCQLYKEYTPAPAERYELKPRPNLWWEVRDNLTGVSCEFLEGMYFKDRKSSVPAEQTENLNTIIRDMGKWLYDDHHDISICNKEARKSVINKLPHEDWWKTLVAAFNGIWFTGNEPMDIRFVIYEQLKDFLEEQNPFNVDANELVHFHFWYYDVDESRPGDADDYRITTGECQEILAMVHAFWESNTNIDTWARDILLWPTMVK